MRRFFLSLAFLVVVLLVGIGVAVQSPKFWQYVFERGINGRFEGVSIKDVSIQSVHWHFPNVNFQDVHAKAKIKGASYFFSIGNIELNALKALHAQHIAIVSDGINVSEGKINADIAMDALRFKGARGKINALKLEVDKYALDEVKANFTLSPNQFEFKNINAGFYKGVIDADILIGTQQHLTYMIDANFDRVDVNALSSVNAFIFGQMKGLIKGQLKLSSAANGLNNIEAHIQTLDGGEIRAELLRYLAQYIPQRQQLEELIKLNANIPLDQGDVVLKSIGSKQLSSQITMKSSKLNLDMNVALDVNIEGGLSGLLGYLNQIQ